MKSTKTLIYCDESGNSGDNYLDHAQPFYVLAGWAVSEDAVVEASRLVENTRKKYFQQRQELKSYPFLKSEQGKRRAVELISGLGAAGCVPIMVVAEKRFCVAGKIVETFLDPAFNDKLRAAFSWDTLTKRELANTLMAKLPPDVLSHFAEAYRKPSSKSFLTCLEEISCAARSFVNPELGVCMEGSLSAIEAIAESEDPSASRLGKLSQSVNVPVLMAFFLMVENLGRCGAIDPVKVVHDEQAVFEKDMKEIFRLHREANDFVVDIPYSDIPYSNFKHISAFELTPSVSCQMIQASDVLAGAVNHIMSLALTGQKPTPADMDLAMLTVPGFFQKELPIAWLIASESLWRKLVKTFLQPVVAEKGVFPGTVGRPHFSLDRNEMFPVVGVEPDESKSARERFKWDLPIYGILGTQSGGLMMVNTGDFELEGETYEGVVALFTSQEKAAIFLGYWDPENLNELQEVKEFGPRELPQLISLLEGASMKVKILIVDPGLNDKERKFLDLDHVIAGLTRMLDRIRRVFSSGLDKIMIQNHDVSGVQVTTMLTSTGDYGALLRPDGKQYRGKTRERALAALIDGEGLSPSFPKP